ncbi:MAG: hypothetical protein R2729_21485 [Bryobacteraceae bacterium]
MKSTIRISVSILATLAPVFAASASGPFRAVSAGDASRYALNVGAPEVGVSGWIWSDKYVYQPGQQLTLKATIKPNNDLYPYTVFLYRQNNQDGKKYYWPTGTENVTDIFGNTLAQGFQPTQVQAAEKATLIGSGGTLSSTAFAIPNELGMHTIVWELRDYTGSRVLKAKYMKIGVVDGEETITGNITASRTLVNTKSYRISGIVFVNNNAVLTIQPGTFIIGNPGSQPPSALIITRNGRIEAAGTRSRPIIMTSSQAFGQRQRGDWGGLVLLGRAPVNTAAGSRDNNQAGEFNIEGLPASADTIFGGTDNASNCGTLTYVRVEYAGSILSPNNELNSFTFGSCGVGTTAHHLQAIYGLDDSFEWFGGTMNAKYLIGGLGADDYLDFQLGWTGKVQNGIFYQSPDARGNRGIEGDNSEYNNAAEPFSNPTFYNLTFVGSAEDGFDEAGSSTGIYLRRGARASINNVAVTNFGNQALRINDAPTVTEYEAGRLKFNGLLVWNNSRILNPPGANTVAGQFHSSGAPVANDAASKTLIVNPLMARPLEYSDPDWRGRFGSPLFRAGWVSPADDGFFSQDEKYIGGIGDDDWTEEWTNFLVDTDIQ